MHAAEADNSTGDRILRREAEVVCRLCRHWLGADAAALVLLDGGRGDRTPFVVATVRALEGAMAKAADEIASQLDRKQGAVRLRFSSTRSGILSEFGKSGFEKGVAFKVPFPPAISGFVVALFRRGVRISTRSLNSLRGLLVDLLPELRLLPGAEVGNATSAAVLERAVGWHRDGVAVLSRRGIVVANPAFCALMGRERSELVGLPVDRFLELVVEGDRERVRLALGRVLQGESPSESVSFRLRSPDGTDRFVEAVLALILLDGRPAAGLSCVDVTDRRRAERSAREHRTLEKLLFERTPMGVVILEENRVLQANPAFLGRVGRGLDEVTGVRFDSLFERSRRAVVRRWLRELASGAQSAGLRSLLLRADGSGTPVELHGASVSTADRARTCVFVRDVGEEETLRATLTGLTHRIGIFRKLVRATVAAQTEEKAAETVLRTLPDFLPIHAGKVVRYLLGKGDTEVVAEFAVEEGASPLEVPPGWWVDSLPDRRPFVNNNLEAASGDAEWLRSAWESGYRSFLCVPLLLGGKLHGSLNLYSRVEGIFQGENLETLVQVAEILSMGLEQVRLRRSAELYSQELERRVEERSKQLEERALELEELNAALVNLLDDLQATNVRLERTTDALMRANEDLRSFATTVSHDLRAPLRAIQAFTQAAIDESGDSLGEEVLMYLDRALEAARRMDELISDLLEYSRLGTMPIRPEALDLDEIAERALQIHQPEVRKTGAQLEVKRPLGRVIGHEGVLVQVVSNLISNALKFVRPGRKPVVRIYSEVRGDVRRVWVEDNGIGIEPQYHERIFQAFERLHGIEKYPGTGVGLAIVRRGIERLNGKVGVESQLGKGSRFWFELPRPPEETAKS